MTNPICTDIVCDTTVPVSAVPGTPVLTPTCGLPTNQIFTNATIHTNASGCISVIESGSPFLYTPDPCCPTGGTGTGSGSTGLDGPAGPAGAAATVTIGTVATGAAGTAASIVNIGTNNAAILNFTIPAGTPGLDGATPSGLDYNTDGLQITNGLVQQLPSWWPPVTEVTPAVQTNNGISIAFSKAANGSMAVVLDASAMQANFNASQLAQNNTIATLTSTIATLQTALDTLKARVDAAGIP
jgi:hypothetical protein